MLHLQFCVVFFFFKQKTAYEMRISDWSSDVCSSDLTDQVAAVQQGANRRQHKGARLIDDTMLRPMRFSMYYNIVQYQQDNVQIGDFYTGKNVTVNQIGRASCRERVCQYV